MLMALCLYRIPVWIVSTELLREVPLMDRLLIGCCGMDNIYCPILLHFRGFVYVT